MPGFIIYVPCHVPLHVPTHPTPHSKPCSTPCSTLFHAMFDFMLHPTSFHMPYFTSCSHHIPSHFPSHAPCHCARHLPHLFHATPTTFHAIVQALSLPTTPHARLHLLTAPSALGSVPPAQDHPRVTQAQKMVLDPSPLPDVASVDMGPRNVSTEQGGARASQLPKVRLPRSFQAGTPQAPAMEPSTLESLQDPLM